MLMRLRCSSWSRPDAGGRPEALDHLVRGLRRWLVGACLDGRHRVPHLAKACCGRGADFVWVGSRRADRTCTRRGHELSPNKPEPSNPRTPRRWGYRLTSRFKRTCGLPSARPKKPWRRPDAISKARLCPRPVCGFSTMPRQAELSCPRPSRTNLWRVVWPVPRAPRHAFAIHALSAMD